MTALESAGLGPSERIALVGYSKGALDILQFLVDFPAPAAWVDAVVSVSGPITGSPLAAEFEAPEDVVERFRKSIGHLFEDEV